MDFDLSKLDNITSTIKPAPVKKEHKRYIKIDREREAEAQQHEMYKAYQDAIMKSEKLRSEILKSIYEAENPYTLFLKAVQAISLMTGDSAYYEQARKAVKTVYGMGLLEPAALEIELKDVQKRIGCLEKAKTMNPNEGKQIQQAIDSHKEREEYLLKAINR